MKKYLILLLSILLLAFVAMGESEDFQEISYAVSQSAGHYSADNTIGKPLPFDHNYSFKEDQFLQCKVLSVAKNDGLQLLVINTDTGQEIINVQEKHLTFLKQMRLPKGNYQIQIIPHSPQVTFDYNITTKPFDALSLSDQEKYNNL